MGGDSDFRRKLLNFDEDTWGEYPRETFDPPSVDDEGVLDGMVFNGCPFQWIIDSIPTV